ncbi:hypothetical protein N0V86_009850 [Didymella sp. IMI 355093]|nr:hypothetical protein N0V86_009850 [Didymella sp. IMI 355093]
MDWTSEFNPDPTFTAWGPFIRDNYYIQPVTYRAITLAGLVFGLANIFAISAAYIAFRQTMACRRPWKSAYIWMIWLELAASFVIAVECLLYLLKVVRPSFWFYMSILLNWSIQVQLLLQIIINRVCIILADKRKGQMLLIGTAVIVTLINISVFLVWMPARLQISERWIYINNIWDRIEKFLYLLIDGFLNVYFMRVVKANLVKNGLDKYNKLVLFNQHMIVISLLMDVMIIAAMWIPNGFVYAIFHPLAYLVKLNIEMSMAHLIKKIATDRSSNSDLCIIPNSYNSAFKCCTQDSGPLPPSRQTISILKSVFGRNQSSPPAARNGILKMEEFRVQSGPITDLEMQQSSEINDSDIYDGSSFVSNNESVAWVDADKLTPKLTPCVQSSCTNPADQAKTIEVLSAICAAAGFPIEVPASPASTIADPSVAPTSEAASEPTSEAPIETQPSFTDEPGYSAYPTEIPPASYPTPTHATSDVPNLPSSYSEYEPIPSSVIVSRPSPHPTSIPGVLPPYPTSVEFPSGSPVPTVPAPTGTGVQPTASSSMPPEFSGAAVAVKIPVMAAGVFGLAAFVL